MHIRCMLMTAGIMGFAGHYAHAQRVIAAESLSGAADTRAAQVVLQRKVTADIRGLSVPRTIDSLAQLANARVAYRGDLMAKYEDVVRFRVRDVALGDALAQLLQGTSLAVQPAEEGRIAIVEIPVDQVAAALSGIIVGKVVHAKTRQPLAGATIILDDAAQGATTGKDGSFRLSAETGERRVSVRALGFIRQTKRIVVKEGTTTTLDISLEPSASVLDEVVVTGTVIATERKAITTPITVITADEIEKRGITRIEQFFRGEVPGIIATERASTAYDIGAAYSPILGGRERAQVYVRGSSDVDQQAVVGMATPSGLKTFIDGVEILDQSYLGTIDPQSIERIEIITGPQAATIYGSGAMGGVMQIFTKKGNGQNRTDVSLNLRYGMLESSMGSGFTPTHNHVFGVTGGTGPEFSYSGNLSYVYQGQWQPALFSRSFGGSAGVTYTRSLFVVTGSVSTTANKNGTTSGSGNPLFDALRENGTLNRASSRVFSRTVSTSFSQTSALNIDYRPSPIWQHHVTIGRSQTNFKNIPSAPQFSRPSDTLFLNASSSGQRTSLGYNTTLRPQNFNVFSVALTIGANGSLGGQTSVSGCTPTKMTTVLAGCSEGDVVQVNQSVDSKSWGGFGSMQLGLFNQLFLTLGLRGEKNPSYGNEHKIDWTPTNGLAYTLELGQTTIKMLASYGSATRAPTPDQKQSMLSISPSRDPVQLYRRMENPMLTPEYSKGPQGGIELYFGNRGSVTLNRYQQTVTNLIQLFPLADSVLVMYPPDPTSYVYYIEQFQNIAKVKNHGWESTGSLNLGSFSLRGTYSWTDSRIAETSEYGICVGCIPQFYPGMTFRRFPTHTANVTVGYTMAKTNVTLVSNWVGAHVQNGPANIVYQREANTRIRVYAPIWTIGRLQDFTRQGYIKSDLAILHRVTPWATATLNISNLGNNFGSEESKIYPVLGRSTLLGISLRSPR